jgi:hypothetical protein
MGKKITSSVVGFLTDLLLFSIYQKLPNKSGGGKNPLIIGGLFFLAILIFGFIYWWVLSQS